MMGIFILVDTNFIKLNRINKKGGSVSVFVDSTCRCKPVDNMTIVVDDVLEFLS